MKKEKTWPYFLISLFFSSFPLLPLTPFAPFFALICRRFSILKTLWIGAFCGCLLDLGTTAPFGLHATLSVLTLLSLHRLRIYIVDKPIGLMSYTFLMSLICAFYSRLFLLALDPSLSFSFLGILTDFIACPMLDALYAFICFSFPLIGYHLVKKQVLKFIKSRTEKSYATRQN
ncbi:MAG: hypothetical protein KDK60_02085, partial [Chlamydiia bacterium]|nr:hypothetical protein [Chlamydiia bacterium]